jgi:Ca-activated chloride channel family protein
MVQGRFIDVDQGFPQQFRQEYRPSILARNMKESRSMVKIAASVLVTVLAQGAWSPRALSASQEPSFKAGVELVTLFAVVRDRQGRLVTNLTTRDFDVVDAGQHRAIVDCRVEQGPVTVAILTDISGSMVVSARLAAVRAVVRQLLSWLNDGEDQMALFAFDDQLHELQTFTTVRADVDSRLDGLEPFGNTSLYDAIWQVGAELAGRTGSRGAVVVVTDGQDTHSRLNALEATRVVSLVDVPVYVIAVDPSADHLNDPAAGSLRNLARATGGEYFTTSAPAHSSLAVRQIVSELRHRYVIAFEPGAPAGWHPLAVRTTNRDLAVRARSGYLAGTHREPS